MNLVITIYHGIDGKKLAHRHCIVVAINEESSRYVIAMPIFLPFEIANEKSSSSSSAYEA